MRFPGLSDTTKKYRYLVDVVADGETLEARDLVGHRLSGVATRTPGGVFGQLGAALDAVAVLEAVVAVAVHLLVGAFLDDARVGSLGIRAVVSAVSLNAKKKNKSNYVFLYLQSSAVANFISIM